MRSERLRTALLCTAALLAGSGTTLGVVGAFVAPTGTRGSMLLTIAALPLVVLGVVALLGAMAVSARRG